MENGKKRRNSEEEERKTNYVVEETRIDRRTDIHTDRHNGFVVRGHHTMSLQTQSTAHRREL